MASYQEILNQIETLKRQAEDVRKQEMANAIADVKRIMAEYGITPADLGLAGRPAAKGKRATVAAKYRDPASGKTWSGRGRKPAWVAALLAEGKNLDAYKA
ncbi:MAG: H-NS histone family protein [Pseudomonadota bacterium]